MDNEPDHKGPSEFARKTFTYPILLDANAVFAQYQVRAFPTTFVIDASGKVVNRHVGFGAGLEKQFAAEAEQWLAARGAVPTQSRAAAPPPAKVGEAAAR